MMRLIAPKIIILALNPMRNNPNEKLLIPVMLMKKIFLALDPMRKNPSEKLLILVILMKKTMLRKENRKTQSSQC